MTDGNGLPINVILTAGNRHESTQLEALIDGVHVRQKCGRPRKKFKAIAAYKGYSGIANRRKLQKRGIKCVIPLKSNKKVRRGRKFELDTSLYRRRNVVERCIGWLKELLRFATRFEKLAELFSDG